MSQFQIPGGPYTLSLDSLDMTLLGRYLDRHSEENGPQTSLDLDGESSYCNVEIVGEEIDEDSHTYTCCICNVEVPREFYNEHINSKKHQTYDKISKEIIKNVSKHTIIGTDEVKENIERDFYYCESCSKSVPLNNKEKHEVSSYHLKSIENDNFIDYFLTLYTKKRFDYENTMNNNNGYHHESIFISDANFAGSNESLKLEQYELENDDESNTSTSRNSNDETEVHNSNSDHSSSRDVEEDGSLKTDGKFYAYCKQFTYINKREAHCDVCDKPIVNDKENIINHAEGYSHKQIVHRLFHKNCMKAAYKIPLYYCELCEVLTECFMDHLEDEDHINLQRLSCLDLKENLLEYIYEFPPISEYKVIYEEMMAKNRMKVLSGSFYCQLCHLDILRNKQIDHIYGTKHKRVLRMLLKNPC